MSTGLLNQLEAYYTDVEATHHDVTPDRVAEYTERVRAVPAPQPVTVRTKPKVWVAVAAAAAVILLIAVVPVLMGLIGDDTPPATDPTPTTVPATTTTVDASSNTTLSGTEFIADVAGATEATAWPNTDALVSADGAAVYGELPLWGGWTVQALDLPHTVLGNIGSGEPGFAHRYWAFDRGWQCVWGYSYATTDEACQVIDETGERPEGLIEDPDEALYVSDDGITWTRTSFPGFEGQAVGRVGVNRGRPVVSVGDQRDVADTRWFEGDTVGLRVDYTTDDGTQWYEFENVWHPVAELNGIGVDVRNEGFVFSPDDGATVLAAEAPEIGNRSWSTVFASQNSFYALLGSHSWEDNLITDFLLLSSADGRDWEIAASPDLPPIPFDGSQVIAHSLPNGNVFLASTFDSGDEGRNIDQRSIAYVSGDSGRTWQPAEGLPTDRNGDPIPINAYSVAVVDDWLWLGNGSGGWAATNGTEWMRVGSYVGLDHGVLRSSEGILLPPDD